MPKIDVRQVAQQVSERLEPLYRESILPAYQATAEEDGTMTHISAMTAEIEMLRQYLERYVTELVSEVVHQLDEA